MLYRLRTVNSNIEYYVTIFTNKGRLKYYFVIIYKILFQTLIIQNILFCSLLRTLFKIRKKNR